MGNFNRGNRSGGRGFVQMHQATCDNCKRNCEVPFRPTNGRPIFCSSCFEGSKGSDSRRSTNFEDRQMFEAVCDECRNSCKVPFQPSSGKPIYCSNCFGKKKGSGDRNSELSQPQYETQFEQLNNKLDKILIMLAPNALTPAVLEKAVETVEVSQPEEQAVNTEETLKVSKKKSSKKK